MKKNSKIIKNFLGVGTFFALACLIFILVNIANTRASFSDQDKIKNNEIKTGNW